MRIDSVVLFGVVAFSTIKGFVSITLDEAKIQTGTVEDQGGEDSAYWSKLLRAVQEMSAPTAAPTKQPTPNPTTLPPVDPPTPDPTPSPTADPTRGPTAESTPDPTPGPTEGPTPGPTPDPTPGPTPIQTPDPTAGPTPGQTVDPTLAPTPTPPPTDPPTPAPVTPPPTPDSCEGVDCSGLPNVASATCVDGECVIETCDGNFGDCDQVVDNGCETDLSDDTNNCGSCGNGCTAICTDGVCDNPNPECEGSTCEIFVPCNESGGCSLPVCAEVFEGGGVCVDGNVSCGSVPPCPGGTPDCPAGSLCLINTCCGFNVCASPGIFCVSTRGFGFSTHDRINTAKGPTIGGL